MDPHRFSDLFDPEIGNPIGLFTCGPFSTLSVQRDVFGGTVPQAAAAVTGYSVEADSLPTLDPSHVVALDMGPRMRRRMGRTVTGTVLYVSKEQLSLAGELGDSSVACRRVLLDDGSRAWSFLAKDPLSAAERIAVVGDSIAYGMSCPDGGWAASLARRHTGADPAHRYWNLAIPGARLIDLVTRAESEVAPRRVDTVILAAGVNDLARGEGQVTPLQLLTAVDSYCAAAEASGRRPVVCTPVWVAEDRARTEFGVVVQDADLRTYRGLLQDWAAATHRDLIDLYPVLENRSDLFSDGLHPTSEGHHLLARAVEER